MPPKPQKPKAPVGYKAASLAKDLLPASVKNVPRDGRSVRVPDAAVLAANAAAVAQLNAPIFEEFAKVEEWPGDEAAKAFDFAIESSTLFSDSTCNPFRLTPSLSSDKSNLIFWRRPTEFIQAEHEEISQFVSKYHLKRRTSQIISAADSPIASAIRNEEFTNSPSRNQIGASEEPKIAVKVFVHYERQETPQEAEIRKKELAEKAEKEKKAKKAGKKEEPVEDKPGFVKDIRLSNIDLSYNYPADSKWIASQLQLIKDRSIRDCYTNKPIWTKIYPQQEGIPVTNKSGRYWVKLYYLGKERKIEIDDRMPVNFKGQCKFPRSTKKEEIWASLFSKAIFKLIQMSQDITHLKNLCGNGFVMYALTGMLSSSIPMQLATTQQHHHTNASEQWLETLNFLKDTLSDEHYTSQDIILTCYSEHNHQQANRSTKNSNASVSLTAHKKESLGSLHEDPNENYSPSQREHQPNSAEHQEYDTPVRNDSMNNGGEFESTPQHQNNNNNNRNNEDDSSSNYQNYDDNSYSGGENGNSHSRSPYRRRQQRNLSTGGLARSSTQIYQTLSSRVKHDNFSNIEEEESLSSSNISQSNNHNNNSSSNNSRSMSPQRTQQSRLNASMQKANNIIQSASKSIPPSYVISGYSYPIMECFFNESFNMVYVQKRSDKEIKLRQEYIELSNILINKMNKEEKIEHRRKKKDLRDRMAEEDKKRIELITRPPIQYKYFRLKSGAGRVPEINILSPFTSDEIEIAKTCIVNKLNKPPNYQEGVEIRDDGKSVVSSVLKNNDESLQMKPLDDFSSLTNFNEPMPRDHGGVWVQDADLSNSFQHFQLFYNPTNEEEEERETVNVSQAVDSEITIGEDHEVLLVERNSERENQDERVNLLFSFTAKEARNARITPEPYCILQKFDFGTFSAIHEYPPLRGNHSSQFTEIDNSNQVFKLLAYTPVSFSLNISCNNTFRTMSVLNYLTEYEGYTVKNFTLEYQPMEEKKYHVLFRMRIAAQEQESAFLLKIRSSTDNQMLRYMRLKLVEVDGEGEGVMLGTIEGVNKNLFESTFTLSNYLRLSLRERTSYYLVLEGEPPYSIAEGALSVDFYSKSNELQVENLEHVEPLQYVEKYLPTKYGIIFREKIYVGENTVASFHLKLMDILGGVAPSAAAVDPKKKGAKAGPAAADSSEGQEKELEDKRLIKLELFENSRSIQYATGFNTSLLSNIALKSTKSEETQYLLEATFDLRDWPEAKTLSALTENIHWFLKIVTTDTVVVVRDTDKEDREKGIKKSWEDAEAGRAEKSKKSRRKHQLIAKQENGEKLTEEELAILAEPRLSKKQREEAAALNQPGGAGAKKAAKKDDKKPPPAKGGKGAKEEVVEEKKEVRPLPLSKNHRTNEIKAFLEHMEEQRVSEHLAEHAGLIDIRSEENKAKLIEDADKAREEVNQLLSRNSQLRDELKAYQTEQQKTIQALLQEDRVAAKDSWTRFLEQREIVKSKMSSKVIKEKELTDILRAEKPTISIADLEKLIAECAAIPDVTPQLLVTAKKLVKNLRIAQLADKFTDALATFNVEALNAGMEDFTNYCVTGIEEELLQKVNEMITEAKENPNYTADKLAEQKKAGKKGKK